MAIGKSDMVIKMPAKLVDPGPLAPLELLLVHMHLIPAPQLELLAPPSIAIPMAIALALHP